MTQDWDLLAEPQPGFVATGGVQIRRGNLPGATSAFDPAPAATFRVTGRVNNATSGSWTVRLKAASGATLAEVSFGSADPDAGSIAMRQASFAWPATDEGLHDLSVVRSGTFAGSFDLLDAGLSMAQSGTIAATVARVPIAVAADVAKLTYDVQVDAVYYNHVAADFSPAPQVRLRATARGSSCVKTSVRLVDAAGDTVFGSTLSFGATTLSSAESGPLSLTDGLHQV